MCSRSGIDWRRLRIVRPLHYVLDECRICAEMVHILSISADERHSCRIMVAEATRTEASLVVGYSNDLDIAYGWRYGLSSRLEQRHSYDSRGCNDSSLIGSGIIRLWRSPIWRTKPQSQSLGLVVDTYRNDIPLYRF